MNDMKKQNLIKTAAVILIAALLLTAVACKGKQKEYDSKSIVASIGDEKVNFALYNAAFDSYASYFQQMGFDPFKDEKELEDFQDMVINALVDDIVTLHHAKEDGFTISEEDISEVNKQAEEELAQIREQYMALAQEAAEQDPTLNVDEQFNALIGELAAYYTSEKMTFEEYSEEYKRELLNSKLIEEYKEHVCSEFSVSEAEISNWYSTQYESDEQLYSENPGQFKADMENYERFGDTNTDAIPPVFVPEGFSRIMDIAIRPTGAISEEYSKKLEELTSVGEECSALLFNDALEGGNANAQRIAELLERYRELETETDAMYDEYIAEARQKIDAAYAELEEGKPFPEVMLKYTDNTIVTGKDNEPGCIAFQQKGQLISTIHSSTLDWSNTVKEIYSMTPKGQYSTVFADEDGTLRIIFHGEDETPGAVDIETIRTAVENAVRAQRADADWSELIDAWTDDPNLKISMDIVRSLGRDRIGTTATESGNQ